MKIIIAGGTGFLGENLEKYFTEKETGSISLPENLVVKTKSIGMQKQ